MSLDDKDEDAEKKKPVLNSLFFEGLGSGLLYSINYERRVLDDLGVRIGFSYASLDAFSGTSSSTLVTLPITASYLGVRSGKHALELGGGVTPMFGSAVSRGGVGSASSSGAGAFGDLLIGYRLHPVGGAGFQFRVGLMALLGPGFTFSIDDPNEFGLLPWFYISFGAGF